MCGLRTSDQAVVPDSPDDATVCGPCLIAAEVHRRIVVEYLLNWKYPAQTPLEAAGELLSGPFIESLALDAWLEPDALVRFIIESGYSYPTFAEGV